MTMSNNSNNSDYSKKEEFRRYLEKTGVLDALTKVLVGLYEEPERPTNALEYVKKYLGAPTAIDIDGLKRENDELKRQLEVLKQQQLQQHRRPSASAVPSVGGGGGAAVAGAGGASGSSSAKKADS